MTLSKFIFRQQEPCIRAGKAFVGIEREPTHYATAVDRIRRELQQQTLAI